VYISAIKKPRPEKALEKTNKGQAPLRVVTDDDAFEQPSVGRKPILIGAFMLILFLIGLGVWAATAKISSAAIAPGVVVVEGERKTVQHFEGGVIQNLLVSQADKVEAGDVLIVLDSTRAEADLAILKDHLILAEARAARLRAERDNLEAIVFPQELLDIDNKPAVEDAISDQVRQFQARRQRFDKLLVGYQQQLEQLDQQVKARKAERQSRSRTLALLREEIEKLTALKEKGLLPGNQLYELQRSESSVIAQRSAGLAAVAVANEEIANVNLQILELDDQRSNAADQELQDLQGDLLATRQRLRTAEQTMRRTQITAPTDGTIMNMNFHTPGGVIRPGEPILDIVPGSPKLVVNARIEPKDRDVVDAGLAAEVRFSAFNRRQTQPVSGTVVFVSADHVDEGNDKPPYFLAQVELTLADEENRKSTPSANTPLPEIHPGMQAEVIIVTGERTLFDYLLQPVKSSLNRALKED